MIVTYDHIILVQASDLKVQASFTVV